MMKKSIIKNSITLSYLSEEKLNKEKSYYVSEAECLNGHCEVVSRLPPQSACFHYPNSAPVLNHYLFKGRQTFKNNFRVLVAGGGTGSSITFMGEELRHTNTEVS